jgi:hypothetical protein
MTTEILHVIPVLPSADIERDITWYKDKVGFEVVFSDSMYAALVRQDICLHLQWHADTPGDPLLGGSVIRIYVKNITDLFEELISRGTITRSQMRTNTPWKTNEFGFYDLNNNAIFVMEDSSNNRP